MTKPWITCELKKSIAVNQKSSKLLWKEIKDLITMKKKTNFTSVTKILKNGSIIIN